VAYCIGLDIGKQGAAVLLEGNSAVFACHWQQHTVKKRKVYRITQATTGGVQVRVIDHLVNGWGLGEALYGVVSEYLLLAKRIHVVAEDVYLGVNPRTSIELAKFGGAIVSRLERFDPEKQALWVKPNIWRAAVLRLPSRTPREEAKAASMDGVPKVVHGLSALLDKMPNAAREHVCDAAGVASYGILHVASTDSSSPH
jgi:hypothetical protein